MPPTDLGASVVLSDGDVMSADTTFCDWPIGMRSDVLAPIQAALADAQSMKVVMMSRREYGIAMRFAVDEIQP